MVLPAPFGPEQRDPLAAVHVQVDAEERLVAVGVGEGEAADVEDGVLIGARPSGRQSPV